MCTEYGYVRVSTLKQKAERQIYNIHKQYPDAVIISENGTGTTMDRRKWNGLVKALKPGDTIIFDKVSRMSRTAQEGFETYLDLYNKNINLIFIKEPHLNTDVFRAALESKVQLTGSDVDCILQGVNQYLMILAKKQIEVAFQTAEHEVEYLHKRTSEGIARAKAEGKQIGRVKGRKVETTKSKEMKQRILKMSKDFNGSMTDAECMDTLGIARNSYYKYKKELKEN